MSYETFRPPSMKRKNLSPVDKDEAPQLISCQWDNKFSKPGHVPVPREKRWEI